MVYLAFGLLGLGAVLILAGLLSGQKSTPAAPAAAPPPAPAAPVPPAPEATPQTSEPMPENTFHKPPGQAPPEPPRAPSIDVQVGRENPALFQKEAYLYLDHSNTNLYDGTGHNFHIMETENIKRFGKGTLSYDGFSFYFLHNKKVERFPVESIEQAAFYPNCIALVPKSGRPTALFFVDSTSSIRSILDTFRIEHVSQLPR